MIVGAHGGAAAQIVAGLPLEGRLLQAGRRAGFGGVVRPGDADAALDGAGGRIVVVPANVVPQVAWLRALREMPVRPERLYVDASGVAVIDTADPERAVAAARARTLPAQYEVVDGSFDTAGRFVIRSAADVPAAERWLLSSLIKPTEGFMSRHVERRVSLAVTRRLMRTRMTPNAMTLISIAIGLASAPFFLSSAPAFQLVGALLFLTHSILDGCDGELARLKFMESPIGAVLDFWGDNLVHVAVFGALAVGWSRQVGAAWPLGVGAVAIAATVATASLLAHRFTAPATAEHRTLGARLADTLAHRDFIYVILVLAAFGRAAWFLAVMAVGAPLFLLALLALGGARRGA